MIPDTGLLCRTENPNGTEDLEVVLQANGTRSLVFSQRVLDESGALMGRTVVGMQSTVHCALQVAAVDALPYKRLGRCHPVAAGETVPNCDAVGETGACRCVALTTEAPELDYQRRMVSEAMANCQESVKSNRTFRVLVFGLGGGAMPMYLRNNCAAARVESVELDARVALVAERLLGFMPDQNNRVEITDGFEAVRRRSVTRDHPNELHYDFALVDCFTADGNVPESCRSEAFVHALRDIIAPGGRVLQNVLGADSEAVLSVYKKMFGFVASKKIQVQMGQYLVGASVVGPANSDKVPEKFTGLHK